MSVIDEELERPGRGSGTARWGRRALVLAGCALHGLLFAVAQAAWAPLLAGREGPAALVAGVSVVVALTRLAPGLAWALGVRGSQGAWLRVARVIRDDRDAGKRARRASLLLHAGLQAPALSVGLAVVVGGIGWVLPVLALLAAPLLASRLAASVTAGLAERGTALAALEAVNARAGGGSALPPPARRALGALALTSAVSLTVAFAQLGRPAPAPAVSRCRPAATATLVRLPGPLPGTPLTARADATSVTLTAADGGGPGRIPLARASLCVDEAPGAAWVAWVATPPAPAGGDAGRELSVLLCEAQGAHSGAAAHRDGSAHTDPAAPTDAAPARPANADASGRAYSLRLAPEGYRLDDRVAARVLRSRASWALGALLLLLAFGYARWGFPALLRLPPEAPAASPTAPHARAGRQLATHARAALAWTLALGAAQLAWVAITLGGR